MARLPAMTVEPVEPARPVVPVDALVAVRRWHAGLLDVPPLRFVELAGHLRDRPAGRPGRVERRRGGCGLFGWDAGVGAGVAG